MEKADGFRAFRRTPCASTFVPSCLRGEVRRIVFHSASKKERTGIWVHFKLSHCHYSEVEANYIEVEAKSIEVEAKSIEVEANYIEVEANYNDAFGFGTKRGFIMTDMPKCDNLKYT
ncbi:MAG: hypothetical protein LBF89_10290, partial [Bacteroidales bacterium]|nr:hypothetical protein [Bacteroidales bacterium]